MIGRLTVLMATLACSGCFFGRDSLNCEDPARYGTSISVPPMRVPGDLDLPDESGALQIPPGDQLVVRDVEAMTECIEAPPDFFEDENAQGSTQ